MMKAEVTLLPRFGAVAVRRVIHGMEDYDKTGSHLEFASPRRG